MGQSGDFVGQAWCVGDYQRALWLALADPNAHDRPRQRADREALRRHWGAWDRAQAALARSPWIAIVRYLADRPQDFRGALARLPVDRRSLYLAAFQSFLWNRMLTGLLRRELRPEQLLDVDLAGRTVPMVRQIEAEQLEALRPVALPLPSARIRGREGPWKDLIAAALEPLGLTLDRLRIKYPRDSFFSKGDRPALMFPEKLDYRVEADEVYPRREKLAVRFELPRGCYATIVTRRIALG